MYLRVIVTLAFAPSMLLHVFQRFCYMSEVRQVVPLLRSLGFRLHYKQVLPCYLVIYQFQRWLGCRLEREACPADWTCLR